MTMSRSVKECEATKLQLDAILTNMRAERNAVHMSLRKEGFNFLQEHQTQHDAVVEQTLQAVAYGKTVHLQMRQALLKIGFDY